MDPSFTSPTFKKLELTLMLFVTVLKSQPYVYKRTQSDWRKQKVISNRLRKGQTNIWQNQSWISTSLRQQLNLLSWCHHLFFFQKKPCFMSEFHCFKEMCGLFFHKMYFKSQYLTKSSPIVKCFKWLHWFSLFFKKKILYTLLCTWCCWVCVWKQRCMNDLKGWPFITYTTRTKLKHVQSNSLDKRSETTQHNIRLPPGIYKWPI